jgi:hypothetical protein
LQQCLGRNGLLILGLGNGTGLRQILETPHAESTD